MKYLSSDQIIDHILSHPTFLNLKKVVENIPQIHDHEDVYTHCVNTFNVARDFIKNPPLSNGNARDRFNEFISGEIHGYRRGKVLEIAALLHDSGKIISIEEDGGTFSINSQRPAKPEGNTYCPGHEYLGSEIVIPVILNGSLPHDVILYIQNLVRLHDTFNTYFPKDWSDEEILYDVKFRAEGYYIEALFNSYCDGYYSSFFTSTRESILRLLNNPSLYNNRNYYIKE